MRKLLTGFGVAATLLVAGVASAAVTEQNFGFKVNGNFNDSVSPGDSVEITSTWDVTSGDQIEYLRTRLYNTNGDIVANDCESVGTIMDANDREVKTHITVPNDVPEGNLTVKQLPFGDPDEGRSPGCDLNFDYGSETNHTGRFFVDDSQGNDDDNAGNSGPGGSSGNSGGSTPDALAALTAQVNALIGQMTGLTGVVATLMPDAICAQLPTGVSFGQHGATALQNFLMSNGQSIGWGATGYFGVQTQAALNGFKAAHKCH